MKSKKDEDSWMNKAIRISVKLAEAEDALNESRQETKMAEDAYNKLADAISGLRAQLEDMRKQRDRAVNSAENAESRQIEVQRNLDRCLGWIDAKEGKPPLLEMRPELPF
jgi:septal ring factor EnvC (AmiA/AmiB activator)